MARLLLLLWVIIISVQSLYKGLVYTYYVCNKAYIIEQLCENKAKPELKCDGKCHLKKVMNVNAVSTEDKHQPYLPSLEDIKIPSLFFQDITPLLALRGRSTFLTNNKISFDYAFCYAYELLLAVWHPPRFL